MSNSKNNLLGQIPILLDKVSVVYKLPKERIHTLKEFTIKLFQRRIEYTEFWALKNISFQVPQGQMLGIVGRNGAGKSTVLKLVARVLKPIQGLIKVQGKIAPLIELGTGLDLELTGRENIYLFGSIMGMGKKEMDSKFEAIVDFAELHDFIDAPLRTYSSGMITRLGFAIVTEVSPQIVILDEILAVGDAGFQKKCYKRIEGFRKDNVTILFVSHSLDQVKSFCDQAMWLDQGEIKAYGKTEIVIDQYEEFLQINDH